jgi:cytidyltransferase-like protein
MDGPRTFTVAASGYFDPLHGGHVEYLCRAKELAGQLAGSSARLVVIVNNDAQAAQKKGRAYLSQDDRLRIVGLLECVDEAILSVDADRSVCRTLDQLRPEVFAKGGDRTGAEVPERQVCERLGIRIVDGLGMKVASSSAITSKILNDAVASARGIPASARPMPLKRWGHEEWIVNLPGLYCGKRLHIRAGATTSWHYHKVKDETLFVDRGRADVLLSPDDDESHAEVRRLGPGDSLRLIPGVRHRLRADGGDLSLFEFSTFHSDDDVVRLKP